MRAVRGEENVGERAGGGGEAPATLLVHSPDFIFNTLYFATVFFFFLFFPPICCVPHDHRMYRDMIKPVTSVEHRVDDATSIRFQSSRVMCCKWESRRVT